MKTLHPMRKPITAVLVERGTRAPFPGKTWRLTLACGHEVDKAYRKPRPWSREWDDMRRYRSFWEPKYQPKPPRSVRCPQCPGRPAPGERGVRALRLTREEQTRINAFLFSMIDDEVCFQEPRPFTREMWHRSYQSWSRGGYGWNYLATGGTGIQTALTWYQWVHKRRTIVHADGRIEWVPSKEWRPSVIIRALLEVTGCRPKA